MEKVDVAGGELGIYERDAYGRPVSCTYGGRVLCGIWMARWMNGQDEGSRERAWVGMGLERYGSLENGMGCTKQSPRGIALEPDGRHPNRGGAECGLPGREGGANVLENTSRYMVTKENAGSSLRDIEIHGAPSYQPSGNESVETEGTQKEREKARARVTTLQVRSGRSDPCLERWSPNETWPGDSQLCTASLQAGQNQARCAKMRRPAELPSRQPAPFETGHLISEFGPYQPSPPSPPSFLFSCYRAAMPFCPCVHVYFFWGVWSGPCLLLTGTAILPSVISYPYTAWLALT